MRLDPHRPDKVFLTKAKHEKSKLYIYPLYEYDVSHAQAKEASQIVTAWLNKVRKVLRVMGGSVAYPLLTTEEVNAQMKTASRYHRHPSHAGSELLIPYAKLDRRLDPVHDVILPGKVDIESASHVFNRVAWGDQQWKNVANRVRTEFKPLVLAHLLQVGAKMEDPPT